MTAPAEVSRVDVTEAEHKARVVQAARSFWRIANSFSRAYGKNDSSVLHCRAEAKARISRLRARLTAEQEAKS